MVGVVTDKVYHYHAEALQQGECAPEEAKKLGLSMFWVCLVAWLICFFIFLGMHCTYPKERRRQLELRREEAEAAREMCSRTSKTEPQARELDSHASYLDNEVVREV